MGAGSTASAVLVGPRNPIVGKLAWLIRATLLVCCACLLPGGHASAQQPIAITQPVTDLAEVLPAPEEAALNEKLQARYASGKAQIAVLTVNSTLGEPIEDYAQRIASAWRGGRAGSNDGVLLVLAVQDRRSRIEVGYGLEDRITDGEARSILSRAVPQLQFSDYPGAVQQIVDELIRESDGLPVLAAAEPPPHIFPPSRNLDASLAFLLLMFCGSLFGRYMHFTRDRARAQGAAVARWTLPWFALFVALVGTAAGLLGLGWTLYVAVAIGSFAGWRFLWHQGRLATELLYLSVAGGGSVLIDSLTEAGQQGAGWRLVLLPCGNVLLVWLFSLTEGDRTIGSYSTAEIAEMSEDDLQRLIGTSSTPVFDAIGSFFVNMGHGAGSGSSSDSSSSSSSSFDLHMASSSSSDSSSSSSSSYSGGGGSFGGGGASGSW